MQTFLQFTFSARTKGRRNGSCIHFPHLFAGSPLVHIFFLHAVRKRGCCMSFALHCMQVLFWVIPIVLHVMQKKQMSHAFFLDYAHHFLQLTILFSILCRKMDMTSTCSPLYAYFPLADIFGPQTRQKKRMLTSIFLHLKDADILLHSTPCKLNES